LLVDEIGMNPIIEEIIRDEFRTRRREVELAKEMGFTHVIFIGG